MQRIHSGSPIIGSACAVRVCATHGEITVNQMPDDSLFVPLLQREYALFRWRADWNCYIGGMTMAVSGAALLILGATWLVATLAFGCAADALDRAVYRHDVMEPAGAGREFWCIVAGGGGAVGGLVALSAAVQSGDGQTISVVQHAIVAGFSFFNVTIVSTARNVLDL